MGLSYGQSASLGQGLEGISNSISTIFDPRLSAMAAKSNLESQANALEMKYKPQLYQSQIAQNKASAGAAGAAAAYHNAQTQLANQKALYQKEAVNYPMPTGRFAGVPYAAPTPEEIQNAQNAIAIRLAAAGENPYNWAQSVASFKGQNTNTELGAAQAVIGQGGPVPSANQGFTPEMRGKILAAQGTNDIAKQAETNKGNIQQELIKQAFGGTGRVGATGTGPNTMMKLEDLDKYVQAKFSVPGGNLSPDMIPAANAYKSSMAMLMGQGVDPMTADSIASQHHGAATYSDPFFGSPRMEAGKGFNLTPISRDNAVTIAEQIRADKSKIGMDRASQIMQTMFPNGTIAQNGEGAGITAGMPNQVPAPEQAAAPTVPATGPVAAPTRTGPITLGEKATAKKAEEKRQKDLAYNKQTMERLIPLAQANGVDLNQIFATALAGGQENQSALQEALAPKTQFNSTVPGSAAMGDLGALQPQPEYAPTLTDIQNALRSSAIQSQYGIDPNLVNQYLPQGNAGQIPGVTYTRVK
jgi:hypothetical protein